MAQSSAKYVNPRRFADAKTAVAGKIAISAMGRLAAQLLDDAGSATYDLSFSVDHSGLPAINGRVAATVHVKCQRCLEPMAMNIESDVQVGIVDADDLGAALGNFEPVVVENDRLSLAVLVEDELILSLPSAPLHSPGTCRPPVEIEDGDAITDASGPFAALSKLKSGNHRRRR